MKKSVALGCLLATAAFAPVLAEDAGTSKNANADAAAKSVAYPKGYRNWTAVKSMVIFSDKNPLFDSFGGFHTIYADKGAAKALKGNRKFPTGARFAFDLRQNNEASGAYTEGKRKFVAVSEYNPKKYKETNGWGFQAWEGGDPNKPVLKGLNDQKVCATCHQQQTKDMVFSAWSE